MEFLTHLSAAAAGSLISAVWEGVVLAACVALCLRLVPGITAAARSVVWSVVMVLVVALPFAHLSGNAAVSAAGKQLHIDERISLAIVAVWLLLSLFRAGQLIRSALYLSGISNNSTPIAVTPELAAILDHATPVALCVSDEVDRPSVFGFTHPRILIPASLLDKLSTAELTQIVLHEMEHLRRGDDWTNLLQKLSLVLFPLNPVLVWIERRLCLERELACDDQVLRATNARKAYAACLASLAEHSLVRRGVSLALGAWERQSELVRRVHRILLRPRPRDGPPSGNRVRQHYGGRHGHWRRRSRAQPATGQLRPERRSYYRIRIERCRPRAARQNARPLRPERNLPPRRRKGRRTVPPPPPPRCASYLIPAGSACANDLTPPQGQAQRDLAPHSLRDQCCAASARARSHSHGRNGDLESSCLAADCAGCSAAFSRLLCRCPHWERLALRPTLTNPKP